MSDNSKSKYGDKNIDTIMVDNKCCGIIVDSEKYVIYNVHLSSKLNMDNFVFVLKEKINNSSKNIILMGDFNRDIYVENNMMNIEDKQYFFDDCELYMDSPNIPTSFKTRIITQQLNKMLKPVQANIDHVVYFNRNGELNGIRGEVYGTNKIEYPTHVSYPQKWPSDHYMMQSIIDMNLESIRVGSWNVFGNSGGTLKVRNIFELFNADIIDDNKYNILKKKMSNMMREKLLEFFNTSDVGLMSGPFSNLLNSRYQDEMKLFNIHVCDPEGIDIDNCNIVDQYVEYGYSYLKFIEKNNAKQMMASKTGSSEYLIASIYITGLKAELEHASRINIKRIYRYVKIINDAIYTYLLGENLPEKKIDPQTIETIRIITGESGKLQTNRDVICKYNIVYGVWLLHFYHSIYSDLEMGSIFKDWLISALCTPNTTFKDVIMGDNFIKCDIIGLQEATELRDIVTENLLDEYNIYDKDEYITLIRKI